jgi:predicted O-methyltransferase YrrM
MTTTPTSIGSGTATSEAQVHNVIERAFPGLAASTAFTRAGMSPVELVRLHELVVRFDLRNALEIGMANGTSSLVLCEALRERGGHLTSIDPFQGVPPPQGFGGAGVERVRALGFEVMHRLIERPDYLALPALVDEGARFDLVFIDGWHSFDYTFLDMFYADLLLKDGGILAVHDTTSPAVYRSLRFLEQHKPYDRVSAPMIEYHPVRVVRAVRALGRLASGPTAWEAARSRRDEWQMLSAHRKRASLQVPEYICHPF